MSNLAYAWDDIPPRGTWAVPVAVPRQKIFVVVLRASGFEDYELPVNTITMRIRDVRATYIRVTVPDPTRFTEDILDRTDGRMIIMAGEQTMDGVRHLEEITYANLQNLYYHQGMSDVLTLTGTRFVTHRNPREADLPPGVVEVSKDKYGRYRSRCEIDFFLRPLDVVTVPGASFTVDYIGAVITTDNAYMDVEGE